MQISHKMQCLVKIIRYPKKIVLCLLLLFSLIAGNIMTNQQPLNASSLLPAQPEAAPGSGNNMQELDKMAEKMNNQAAIPSIWPATGPITSGFGWRDAPLADGSEVHQGVDIASGMGIPVVATADGTVIQSGWSGGYGNLVQIDHGNGIETLYGHNEQLAVSVGQRVKKGQLISYAGSTGKSTGPHVHYEVRESGVAINPIKYMVLY